MPAKEGGYSFGTYVPDKMEVLSMATEEYLFEQMGVPLEEGIFVSPFRTDHNPTCSLWRSPKDRLYFTDWAVGDPMDVFKLAQYVYGCDEQQALRTLYDLAKGYNHNIHLDRERRPKPVIDQKPCEIRVRRRDWKKDDLEWWSRFGISLTTLNLFRVAPLEMAWFNERVVYMHPYGIGYVYDFLDHDYKLYFPDKVKYRFLHNRADLLQGYDQLPDTGEYLVITKSLKDVMLFRELGIPAVAPMAESIMVPEHYLQELDRRFDTIVVLMDTDLPGLRALRKYKQLGYQICMIPKRLEAKDITDLYRKVSAAIMAKLIEQAKQFYLPFKEQENATS